MSQSQVADAVGVAEISIRRFLKEKQLQPLSSNSYEFDKAKIEKDWAGRGNRQTIKPVPINLASEFWAVQAFKGNVKAQSLAYSCIQEALERRCDKAFEQMRSEQEYEQEVKPSWVINSLLPYSSMTTAKPIGLYESQEPITAHPIQ
jgi:hypothetical protein